MLFITLELGPTSQKGTPFWCHFGDLFCQENEKRGFQKSPKNHSQKTLKMGPKQWGEGGNLRKICLFSTLNPARTQFAAGKLLDLDFSSFWLRFDPQKHVFGPLNSLLWGAFCCCVWMFFRQSTWRCSKSPRKKSREFPPV